MFDSTKFVSFDTETRLISEGCLAPQIVCCSVADSHTAFLVKGASETCTQLRQILTSGQIIVGANVAYDFGVCVAHDPGLLPLTFDALHQGRVFDVLIATALDLLANGFMRSDGIVDPKTGDWLKTRSGKRVERLSLDACCKLVLDRDNAKENDFWRLRYAILENVPLDDWPQNARQYPIDDAQNTLDVAAALVNKNARNLNDVSAQCRAAFALHLASMWGIRTEEHTVDELERELQSKYNDDLKRFKSSGVIREDNTQDGSFLKKRVALAYGVSGICVRCNGAGKVRSQKTRNDIVCKAGEGGCDGTGLNLASSDALPRTAADGISIDRDTLKESGDAFLESYASVSETRKLLDTYIPYLRSGTKHPINPGVNVLLATGRTSYSGLIQLLPRGGKVRECFVPRQGYYFCSVDYTGLELATLAQCQLWIAGKSALADALNDALDVHTLFAASMRGVSYEDMRAQIKAGDKTAKAYRQAAKPCNFGFPGGMGVATFVQTNRRAGIRFCKILEGAEVCGVEKITEYKRKPTPPLCKRCVELAEELRSNWFRQWPEMKQYFDFISSSVDSRGELEQFVSDRVRGGLDFCSGANTLFQGLAADGAKHALFVVSRECYTQPDSPLFGTRPVIFVHDEIFSEIPIQNASAAAKRKTELMIASMREFVPDMRIHAEPALMTRWYKEAEPKYNSDGQLIPWK